MPEAEVRPLDDAAEVDALAEPAEELLGIEPQGGTVGRQRQHVRGTRLAKEVVAAAGSHDSGRYR
ncbi:MAG: hypothetical protein RLZZ217_2158 [Planctomycetota bacterium]